MINKETPEKKLVMNEVDVDDVIDKLENSLCFARKLKLEGENEEQDVRSLVLDITDTFKYLS